MARHFTHPKLSLFLGVFFFALVFQGYAWFTRDYTDSGIWVPAAEQLLAGHLPPPEAPAYGYPATTFLIPLSVAVHAGVSPKNAVPFVLTLLSALLLALLALLCYVLFPATLWWVGVSGIGGLSLVYQNATPPSSLAMLLVPLLVFLTLYVQKQHSWNAYVLLGVVGGVAIATRWDVCGLVLGLALLFLVVKNPKRAIVAGGIAVVVGILLDPYFFTEGPVLHITSILHKANHHYGHTVVPSFPFHIMKPLLLTFLGFFFGACVLFRKQTQLSKKFLAWLFGVTILVTGILLTSSYHPDWYFYPVFSVWELLLPLFFIVLLEEQRPFARYFPKATSRTWQVLFIGLLVVGQLVVYIHPHLIFEAGVLN